MLFYSTLIISASVIIAVANIVPASESQPLTVILTTVCGVVGVITFDGLLAFVIRRMPERYFSPDKALFDVSRDEHAFYYKIKIKAWKDSVPELGGFTSFHKNTLGNPRDPEYLHRFLLESNYGVVIHFSNIFAGFPLLAFYPSRFIMSIGMPVAAVNVLCSVLPLFILRFNTPMLKNIYLSALKKQSVTSDTENNGILSDTDEKLL